MIGRRKFLKWIGLGTAASATLVAGSTAPETAPVLRAVQRIPNPDDARQYVDVPRYVMTLRETKGHALTARELDDNFRYLEERITRLEHES